MNQKLKSYRFYQHYYWNIRPLYRTYRGKARQKLHAAFRSAVKIVQILERPFHRYKIFEIYLTEEQVSSYEDPKCPSFWRGSGCYDIEVYSLDARLCIVCARTVEEALSKRLASIEERVKDELAAICYKNLSEEQKNRIAAYERNELGYFCQVELVRDTGLMPSFDEINTGILTEFCLTNIKSSNKEADIEITQDALIKEFDCELLAFLTERQNRTQSSLTLS